MDTLIPYLCVDGAVQAIDYYKEALGAEELLRITDEDGRVGHATLQIRDAALYISDEYPEMNIVSPKRHSGTCVSLHLVVEDADAAAQRAVFLGATLLRPCTDQGHGRRNGVILDPFGHRWMLSSPVRSD